MHTPSPGRILLLLITCFFISSTTVAQHSASTMASSGKRNQWIRVTVKELKRINPDSVKPAIEMEFSSYGEWKKLSCRIMKQGIIRIKNGEWICIKTNSVHENEEIGDVSLAIDSKKKIYRNDGHICGGMIHFETTLLDELRSSDDFFKYFVSDTDSAVWQRVK